ncbi:hypothetical protein [Leisingera sp. ANG-DT]|uniref:hypothetical protein n=1 Tax=Leisingera sp. ANG-DT TaxID=1577897 RepID=UPI000583221B|nr:hypothetical protein [Leisingera sp. ANG-DT]KIC19611.1 hypothetical protein RA21_03690 [Leisingera sp. ANG-DT]
MDKQHLGMIFSVLLILVPVISVSFAMTSNSPRLKARGYFGLCALMFIAAGGCFALAITEQNRAGYVWMAFLAYGSYWAWNRAAEIKSK